MKNTMIIKLIELLDEAVMYKKDYEKFNQLLSQAKSLMNEVIQEKKDILIFLEKLFSFTKDKRINKESKQKILLTMAKLLRDNLAFDKSCLYLLEQYKEK